MNKSVIYYLIDGARPDILSKLSQQGKIPNITQYLIENGSFVKGTTCLPSTTGPAYLPMLTGHYPGEHDITGIRWFDKAQYFKSSRWNRGAMRSYCGYEAKYFNDDMNVAFPSLFEEVKSSANIYNMITKGVSDEDDVTKSIKTKLYFNAHFKHLHHPVDEAGHQKLLESLDQQRQFTFAVFPSIDWDSHTYHYDDERTHQSYQIVDRSLGEVIQKLKNQGRYEDTLIVMSSDHGLSSTHSHFDLGKYFKSRGYRVLEYPNIIALRPQIVVSISGNSFASLSLLDQQEEYYEAELLDRHGETLRDFIKQPAIDFIIYRHSPDKYTVEGHRGVARVYQEDDAYYYDAIEGDPLDLGGNHSSLSAQDAFELSIDSDYPDSLFQICQLMKSKRAGDILVCAADGHDLRDFWEYPEHKGSHGSLHKDHMLMPILTNQKDLIPHPVRSNRIHQVIKEWLV